MTWVKPWPDKVLTGHFGKIRTFKGAPTNPHRGTDWAPGRVAHIAVTNGTIRLIKFSKIMGWGIVYTGFANNKTWFVSHHHLACPKHQDKCTGDHPNPFSVKEGDRVTAGKPIAKDVKVGSTGSASSGPHSHTCLSDTLTGAWSGQVFDIVKFIDSLKTEEKPQPKEHQHECKHCGKVMK